MTILSDKEIRNFSMPPRSVVSQNGKIFFSHMTKEDADAGNIQNIGYADIVQAVENKVPDSILKRLWIEHRPVFEEDLKQWKPMIAPFENGQVRTRVRELLDWEIEQVRRTHSEENCQPLPDHLFFDSPDRGFLAREKIVSYGLSSYGYDLRCGHKFKIFTNVNAAIVDPKALDTRSFVDVEVENDGDYVIVPPNGFALTYSMERIIMPPDVTGIVLGKSTYARTGLVCLATPLEAGWEGYVTLEFANTTPLPMKLYAGEGSCQVVFFQGAVPCEVSYAARNGKYMDQPAEVVLPTV